MYQAGEMSSTGGGDIFSGLFTLFIMAALYFYVSFAQYRIAQKVGLAEQAWWGFVPILNVFLFVKCAGRDWYWFLFLLVPIVNIIVGVMLWMDIARQLQKSAFWAILTLVPFINFIAIGVIAFGGNSSTGRFPPHDRTPSNQPTGIV